MNPKVSVIMSVYNNDKYVKIAIDSILHQTYKDYELIIIDDGSTDTTPQIIDTYINHPQVRIIHKQKNEGLQKALNLGISQAKGEYIARLDADDIALPTRLEQQVKYLDQHPEVALLGSCFYTCNDIGQITGKITIPLTNKELQEEIPKHNRFGHSTVMLRKSTLVQLNGYDESFISSEDYDLWLRIAEVAEMANLEQFLTIYRMHAKQITYIKRQETSSEAERARQRMRERRKGKR